MFGGVTKVGKSLEEGAGKQCSEFGGRCRKAMFGVCRGLKTPEQQAEVFPANYKSANLTQLSCAGARFCRQNNRHAAKCRAAQLNSPVFVNH